MRKYYNYAIDLGTTNSCIAKFENGEVKVFQNMDGMEIIPSAIYVNKNGKIIVGRKAVDKGNSEFNDTTSEFKRLMGIQHKHLFSSSGIELTPAELSAEILKSLIEDVFRINGEVVENAVITVPAAFNSIQCESTYEAAKLAGLSNVVLLQEPIAAALAYGADTINDKIYMVFDLGGGTLDVAIVSIRDGNLRIMNHEGNNFLGGKDIDRLIMEDIIIPEIKKEYTLDSESNYNSIYKKLLKFAEEAKKAMSTTNEYRLDIYEVGNDDLGIEIDTQITINSESVNNAAKPIINQCIEVAQKTVLNANLGDKNIEEILLVGGATYLPILRMSLVDNFATPVNTSENPMTVVARGATMYASRLFVEDDFNRNDISVQIEYDNIVQGTNCNIIGKIKNSSEITEIKIIRGEKEWETKWNLIEEDHFDIDLTLNANTNNEFKIILRNSKGYEIFPFNSNFEILSKSNVIKSTTPLLPHTLSLEVESGSNTKLIKMIKKNIPIPARKIEKFKTIKEILPGTRDNLIIKLWEGESENPDLCEWVGNVYISGMDIKYPIPKGAEIEVDILVDISRRITINAYIEYSDVLKSDIKLYSQEPLDITKPLNRIKSEVKNLIDEITIIKNEHSSKPNIIEGVDDLLSMVHSVSIENHKLINIRPLDKDRIMQLLDLIKAIREKLEFIKIEILESLNVSNNIFDDKNRKNKSHIQKYGSEDDKFKYSELEQSLYISKKENDRKGEAFYEEKMDKLVSGVKAKNIDFWYDIFILYQDFRLNYVDIREADVWISKGEEAKKSNDLLSLQNSVIKLYELMIKDNIEVVTEQYLPPGIEYL